MTTTITYGETTITPALVLGYSQTRGSLNLEHPLLDGGVDVTVGTPAVRRGTLRLLFTDEPGVLAAEALHISSPYLDLVSDEREIVNFRYAVGGSGRIVVALDDATRDVWTLEVDFVEVDS